MDLYRLRHTIGMYLTLTGTKRAKYIKKHNIFYHMGEKCMIMPRKIPLYPKLISLGDNVWIASNVSFITHDVIHRMLNNRKTDLEYSEYAGCIDIKDNCFIGACSIILPNVSIGSDTIVGAGSLVNKNLRGGGVYAGVPAHYICSLDEFLEKRDEYPEIKLEHAKNGLSQQCVEACWSQFKEIQEKK